MAYEPWQPGMNLTANRLLSISPTWQAWTPSWTTTSGTALPSLGDATVDCAYAISARTCYWRFDIVFGPTTNFGTNPTTNDNWLFGLPVPAANLAAAIGFVEVGASAGARGVARARLLTTGDFGLELSAGKPDGTAAANTGLVDALSPWTWASGNSIRGFGQYETDA